MTPFFPPLDFFYQGLQKHSAQVVAFMFPRINIKDECLVCLILFQFLLQELHDCRFARTPLTLKTNCKAFFGIRRNYFVQFVCDSLMCLVVEQVFPSAVVGENLELNCIVIAHSPCSFTLPFFLISSMPRCPVIFLSSQRRNVNFSFMS